MGAGPFVKRVFGGWLAEVNELRQLQAHKKQVALNSGSVS